jgi:V/A-type H+-transporting ATPase subunit I
MLRPERMSKVSVTGSKQVMEEVIEAVHGLNAVHLSDYDNSWEGFETGTPLAGAEEASDRLVTVRSLESILGVEDADSGPERIVTEEAIDTQLPEVREAVNDLDDRRDELRAELRGVEERIDAVEPFAELGIDLDLLSGYDSLEVAVGEADAEAVRRAVADADNVRSAEVFSGGDTVAVFVQPSKGKEGVLDDALVGVSFNRLEVPDADGDPEAYVESLESERESLRSELDAVDDDIAELRHEHGGFLVAAEEHLSIAVQQAEAPLQFATTEHAFIAEGWIPSEEYATFAETLRDAVGDRVEVEELERADYTPSHGHETEAVADGGHDTRMEDDGPPVVQDNPGSAKPFELLVETINRPRYFELDPTVVLFMTFPVFYGFMIGDVGYGILYAAGGYLLYSRVDSPALKSLGGIAVWAGVFTVLFGILYGEIFGLHTISAYLWEGALGMDHALIRKGLHTTEFALLWLTLSVIVGVLHLVVGWGFGFVNDLRGHGFKEAFLENGSWVVLTVSVWLWVFSLQGVGSKPGFLAGPESVFNGNPVPLYGMLGIDGIPALVIANIPLGPVGTLPLSVWLVGILAGLVLVVMGEGVVGALESPNALVNVISYTRIAAVLLAKAAMAFAVNLLVFGAYDVEYTDGHTETHFLIGHGLDYPASHYTGEMVEATHILFPGLFKLGVAGALGGVLVLVVGHVLVLALGVTSAGLQAVRLEYVEFFGKFYEGGGAKYQPFGYERTHTTED